ncbi:MAG TPA: hypothetical protein VHS57_08750 [Acidimicrobiales bacterium]|nr:hypothetical protein [Acidimicrobiales bacterium]
MTEPMVFESCHSTWVFDPDHLRFRRVLKGIEVEDRPIVTAWRPYYGLEVEEGSEAFTVLLNEEGTRMIRSWRHTGDCQQCGGHVTAEMSLDEISAVLA